ncbi:MAG: DUF1275 domain-containing protein [Candidatus Eremiobacteraeota bacterium]|nr:DUF1275 domain-containing protein [Candidatus Eremiobacteraeota bacterium]
MNGGRSQSAWASHGPLPTALLGLTVLTGLVDAVSFLRLGHVFVSNMTGNVVFLGFAIAGAGDIAPLRSIVALLAFTFGSAMGGRYCRLFGVHRGRLLAATLAAECLLVGTTLGVSLISLGLSPDVLTNVQVGLLAIAMGMQTAAARKLGVPDLTTTVITLTMTALAAESFFGTGTNRNARHRSSALAAMFVGALSGGALVLHRGVAVALGVALTLLAGIGAVVWRASSGQPPWAQTD